MERLVVSVMYGKSLTLCSGHTNRSFHTNGKHPIATIKLLYNPRVNTQSLTHSLAHSLNLVPRAFVTLVRWTRVTKALETRLVGCVWQSKICRTSALKARDWASSETQGLLAWMMRCLRASDVFGLSSFSPFALWNPGVIDQGWQISGHVLEECLSKTVAVYCDLGGGLPLISDMCVPWRVL